MPIQHIHTYLVHPGRPSDGPAKVGGTEVELEGKLFGLLRDVYQKSDAECDIEISFNQSTAGHQDNDCRDLILEYLKAPTLDNGGAIAKRLEQFTTFRSGLGLLFLIAGNEGAEHKLVISRFPADSAILVEENSRSLSVEFLERVFMKSAHSYKAAAYRGTSLRAGFWTGRAIDKQISNPAVQVSNYWIAQFLESDFQTTSAAGTRRLAVVLRDAARTASDVSVKSEIAAAVTLAGVLKGEATSILDFQQHFGFSDAARQAIGRRIKRDDTVTEKFVFDLDEFSNHVAYRSIELDNGAILTASAKNFADVFHREPIGSDKERSRYWTEGRVESERLNKSR